MLPQVSSHTSGLCGTRQGWQIGMVVSFVVRNDWARQVTCPFADQEPNYADQRQTDWR
jgi:hypothetical protein